MTFIHVPKTGGTSIGKWITSSAHECKKLSNAEHVNFFLFDEIYKNDVFAVARNPYDRLVSYYYHFGNMIYNKTKKGNEIFNKQMDEWNKGFKNFVFECKYLTWRKTILNSLFLYADGSQWIANPQVKYIGKDLSNFTIMKFENLENDFQLLQHKLNDYRPLPEKNTTNSKPLKRGPWQDYYDNETKQEVYKYWQQDFELLGYES
jgi:hypothetical protein